MSALQAQVSFHFFRGVELKDCEHLLDTDGRSTVGGMRFQSLRALPPQKIFVAYVKEAIDLHRAGREYLSHLLRELPPIEARSQLLQTSQMP
jgi:hypothetical protein